MRVLVFDPGDHTGWVARNNDGHIVGGMFEKDLIQVQDLILEHNPHVIVYETFNLYPGKGKSLTRNDFYAVQVIGAIKLVYLQGHEERHALQRNLVGIQPSLKKYSGGLDDRWWIYCDIQKRFQEGWKVTEHQKDAYLLLRYFERHIEEKIDKDPRHGYHSKL